MPEPRSVPATVSICHATHGINQRLWTLHDGRIASDATGITLCGKVLGGPSFGLPTVGATDRVEIVAHGAPLGEAITCPACRDVVDRVCKRKEATS